MTTTTDKGTKGQRITYWICTSLVFLFDGLGALGSNTKMAIDGMRRLGFPDYFRLELGAFKVLGGFFLILPFVSKRLKEWSYVGFGISMISAGIANACVKDPMSNLGVGMAVVWFAILVTSYVMYHKTYGKGIYSNN